MTIVRTSAPTELPVTLDQIKAHLNIDESDNADHALLTDYCFAAVAWVENETRRRLMAQTYDLFLDGFPRGRTLELPPPLVPVTSVGGVYYTPEGGAEATFAAANYTVDTAGDYGRVVLKSSASWPSDVLETANGVRVDVTVGATDRATVEDGLRVAVLQLIARMYELRNAVAVGAFVELPLGTRNLLAQYYAF